MATRSTGRVGVDRLAGDLILLYVRAHRLAQTQMHAALENGALGTARYRAGQVAAIEAVMRRLERNAEPHVEETIRASYRAGAEATDVSTRLAEIGDFQFQGVHEGAVTALVQALRFDLRAAVRSVGREADDVFRRVVIEQSALGAAAGDARRDVTRRAVADLQAHGVTAFRDRAGRRWSLERYANMAVRTTTREAVSIATDHRMQDHGLDLVTMSRHASDDEPCKSWEGRTFSRSGASSRYPPVPMWPPWHPNCRHVATPADANFDDYLAALHARASGASD